MLDQRDELLGLLLNGNRTELMLLLHFKEPCPRWLGIGGSAMLLATPHSKIYLGGALVGLDETAQYRIVK
eukprot:scaffold553_cov184-Chaetoceros_neogracile.AAC.15